MNISNTIAKDLSLFAESQSHGSCINYNMAIFPMGFGFRYIWLFFFPHSKLYVDRKT